MAQYFKVDIHGDSWNIYIVDDDDIVIDEDNDAETDIENKEIHFKRGGINEVSVRHEIWHAYMAYTFTETADLTSGQSEEVSAQIFGVRGPEMVEKAAMIYKKLKELKDKPVKRRNK